MKVLLSAADAAALHAVEFDRTVDTSNPDSKQPTIEVVVPGPAGPKKPNAVTHIVAFERFTVIARRTGEISIGGTVIHDMGAELVGLARDVVALGKQKKRLPVVVASTAAGDARVLAFDTDGSVKSSIGFKLRSGLSCVVSCTASPLLFASAGQEALPNVFKLRISASEVTVEPVWEAESLPNDRLDLPVPNLVSALTFVDATHLVAVTSKGALRVYDTTADTQPVATTQVSKYALRCVAADPQHPGTVLTADSNTLVSRWSTEPLRLLGTYRGVIGSTRTLSIRGDYVALGGLDRYLRVFHITKRQPAGKVYTGHEIWAVELLRTDDDEDQAEVDNMWDALDNKRRRASSPNDEANAKRNRTDSTKNSERESTQDEDRHRDGSDSESSGSGSEGSGSGSEDSDSDENNESSGSDSSFEGFDD